MYISIYEDLGNSVLNNVGDLITELNSISNYEQLDSNIKDSIDNLDDDVFEKFLNYKVFDYTIDEYGEVVFDKIGENFSLFVGSLNEEFGKIEVEPDFNYLDSKQFNDDITRCVLRRYS